MERQRKQKASIISEVLRSDGYLNVSKALIRELGLDNATFLTDLLSKKTYFEDRNQLTDGWFFNTEKNREWDTGLNPDRQRKCTKKLTELGVINHKRKGVPARQWFFVNEGAIENVINDHKNKKRQFNERNNNKRVMNDTEIVHNNKSESFAEQVKPISELVKPISEQVTPISEQEMSISELYNKKLYNKKLYNNQKNKDKNIYTHFLELWNKQGIIIHSKITSKRKKCIDKIIKQNDYSIDEITESLQNYATVLKSPDYYWDHKWNLEEFLIRGLDRFVNESKPLEVFKINKSQVQSMKNDNQFNNNILDNPTHESLHLFPVEKKDLFLEEIKDVASKWMNLDCWEHGYKPSKFKIYEALLKQKVWLNNLMTGDNLHKVDNWENRVFNSTVRRNIGTLTQLSNHFFEWIDNEGQGISLNNEQILFPDSKTFKRFILIESDVLGLINIRSRGWGEDEHLGIDAPKEKIQRCIDNAEELEKKYIIKEQIEDRTKENIKWAESCIMEVLTDYEIKINNINTNWFNEHIADFIGGRKNDGAWKIKFKEIFINIEKKYQLDPKIRKNGYLSSFYNLPEGTIQEILKPTFIPFEKCHHNLEDRRKIYELNTIEDDKSDF